MYTNCDLLMVKCLALMKEPKWDYLMVKCLALYLEIWMESHLGLMLEQSWALKMELLMVLTTASLRDYCLEVHWDLLMVK